MYETKVDGGGSQKEKYKRQNIKKKKEREQVD